MIWKSNMWLILVRLLERSKNEMKGFDMQKAFYCGDAADALIDWARKLESLGNVMAFIGEVKDGEWILTYNNGALGYIISDYAEAIKRTLEESYPFVSKALKDYEEKKEKEHGN
jgi:hypothetical protein